ncbi:MAG: hypothetical protein PWQ85_1020 [Geotoga sp.]|jgi:hypothetical protein|nr:hypothetical protein [Geotoga sp.]
MRRFIDKFSKSCFYNGRGSFEGENALSIIIIINDINNYNKKHILDKECLFFVLIIKIHFKKVIYFIFI